MELVVRKADLLRELQLFQGIVERKNTIPILANVLIRAEGGKLCLCVGCGDQWQRAVSSENGDSTKCQYLWRARSS